MNESFELYKTGNHTPAPTLTPTHPFEPHTNVSLAAGIIVLLMTCVVLFQITKICFFSMHKKISYFSVCLCLALIWGVIRTLLLFEYVVQKHVANNISIVVYLIYFVIPVCIQFTLLSLVALYFACATLNAFPKSIRKNWKKMLHMFCALLNCFFFITNAVCAVKMHQINSYTSDTSSYMNTRVLISELLTMFICCSLVYIVYKLRQLARVNPALEGHGLTLRQVTILTVELVILFSSRFIYNIIGLTDKNVEIWGYKFTFLSDRYDRASDDGDIFILFVVCLFIWEVLPVMIMVWFFWIPRTTSYDDVADNNPILIQPSSVMFDPAQNSSDEEEMFERPIPAWQHSNYGSYSQTIQTYPYGASYGSYQQTPLASLENSINQ